MLQKKRGKLDFKKEKRKCFTFLSPLLVSSTKLLLTNARVLLRHLASVDLELKVQAGHGSLPVFQHLPIYFGKKALVLGTGLHTDLGYKQENTVFSALFEETNNLNPQREGHMPLHRTAVIFKKTADNQA